MNHSSKSRFALFFGNRGFFPASLQSIARQEMSAVLEQAGYSVLMLDENLTRHGAIETAAEGEIYAKFLQDRKGEYDGVILCLPNFGDEVGAAAALRDADVPILVHAYPDDIQKMEPTSRRDAFCGKFSIMDVFCQYGIKFTALQPHVVLPNSETFLSNIRHFDRVCRVVRGMKKLVVGAIGARTTAFKTVRIDELTLQRHGITVETLDLSTVISRVKRLRDDAYEVSQRIKRLKDYTDCSGVPSTAMINMAKLGVVLDQVKDEFALNAIALRCWVELQEQLGISPCALVSVLNNEGVPAACEVDIGSAVTMYALGQASGDATTCLDWNNNYGEEPNKCIVFHCGPVPKSMMTDAGRVTDHGILITVLGEGRSFGPIQGRIKPNPVTFGNLATFDGKMKFYLGEGRITDDLVPEEFFGCAGVAEVENMQEMFVELGYAGHRHHMTMTPGHVAAAVDEAFRRYLGYEVMKV